MEIKLYLKLVKFDNFGPDYEMILFKSYDSNFIPRINEKILDEAIPDKYLLVKEVTWDIKGNKCRIDLVAPGVSRGIDLIESAIPFIENGWSIIE